MRNKDSAKLELINNVKLSKFVLFLLK